MSTDENKFLAQFQKLGKRNKPLYKKAAAFVNGLTQVLQVTNFSSNC